MVKKILVGLSDEKHSKSSTDHALALAKQHTASVTAVTMFDPEALGSGPIPIGAGGTAKELKEHRLQEISHELTQAVKYFKKTAKAAEIEFTLLEEDGSVMERMIAASRYHDLIIFGLKPLFVPGSDPPVELIRLVEEGVRPLIAVADEYREIHKVLIAYSGSSESAKTMKRFVQQKLWPKAEVKIVTFGDDEEKAAELLADATDYCRAHGIEPLVEHVAQSPKSTLLTYATGWEADLLVMGNSAKRLLLRRVFGETALHVVANSDRPLYMCQ